MEYNNKTKDEIIKEASSRLADIFVDLIDEKENKKKDPPDKSINKNEHSNTQ